MSIIKTTSDLLGMATASVAAYIAQDVVAESCQEEQTSKRTEVLARLLTATVVFAVLGSVSKATMDHLFGIESN